MALVVAAGAVSKAAYADPLGALGNTVTGLLSSSDESNNAETQAADAFDEYTVQTVSPSGTTINLFDYWVDDRDSADGGYADPNKGINKDHQLDFTRTGTIRLNQWLESSKGPLYNIVSKNLVGGYPELRSDSSLGTDHTESLAYLFNSTEFEGKEANLNVSGLLQQVDGYYEYDSHNNFASYDAGTNAFKVYEKRAVAATGTSGDGQFFPFNSADEVFDEVGGNLVAKNNVTSTEDEINHYFGLSMTSRFVQPDGGKTSTGADMVFEFTGDDDVWVFIDDVLVGDVGGIHDASSVSINFVTGDVSVRCTNDANAARDWKLDELFKDAGKDTSSFNGHTFADGTEHTLKFFYLERGNVDSNMKLKFNLVTVPNSDIVKIDQDGEPIEDAEFALYEANESFVAQGDAIASGTTDASGNLLLTSVDDGTIINFDELHEEAGSPSTMYYLLEETVVPEGYRTGLSNTDDSMHLVYQYSEAAKSGVLTDAGGTSAESYIWQNGAFAGSKETLTAPGPVYGIDQDNGFTADTGNVIKYEDGGTLFAVVLKRTGDELANQNSWHAMSGDPVNGYTLQTDGGIAGAIKAAQIDSHPFLLNSSGQYQVELTDLPGDITKYYFMLDDNEKNQSEYTVAVYYTKGSLKDATTENTERVYSDDFIRQFSARLYVPNIENRLFVQKDDGAGNYLAGAEFSLYKADQVDADGQLIENAEAYDTVWTQEHLDEPSLDGAAAFPNTKPLVEGTYYLKETTAPEGYELNDTLIKVVVDDTGVHAYAGNEGEDDGVSTFAGVGKLVKSMAQFGAHDSLDNTLTWIAGTRQASTGEVDADGNLVWTDVAGDALHLEYGAAGADVLEYGTTANNTVAYPLETESGWLRVGVTQDEQGADANENAAYTKLGTQNLNALLSGVMGVRVTDEPVSSLEVTKTVEMAEGLAGNPDAEFTFQFDLPYDDGAKTYTARVFNANGEMAVDGEYTLSNDSKKIAIKDGQTIRVYGLAEGSKYTVTETTDGMPQGYTLTKRTVAGAEHEPDSEGNAITGKIEALAAGGAVNPNNKLGFVNTYAPEPAELTGGAALKAQKTFTGREWTEDDEFAFEVTKVSYKESAESEEQKGEDALNAMPAITGTTIGKPESGTVGSGLLGDVTFTKPGIYTYKITETKGSLGGVTYDEHEAYVTITVSETDKDGNYDGALHASVTYDNTGALTDADKGITNAAAFTNTYIASDLDAQINVQFTKSFNGWNTVDAFDNKSFEFTITPKDGAPAPANNTVTVGKPGTGSDATFSFGTITFQARDLGGTTSKDFVYEVKEVTPADTDPAEGIQNGGITYDDHTVKITVTVTDPGTGTLVAAVNSEGDTRFTNTYSSKLDYDAAGGLKITKTLNGRDMTSGQFAFTVTPQAGMGTTADDAKAKLGIDNADNAYKVTAAADGIPSIIDLLGGDVTFTQDDAGKTYVYKINETTVGGAGYTNDTAERTVTIAVVDNGNATLTVTTTVTGGAEGEKTFTYTTGDTVADENKPTAVVPFANSYSASTNEDTSVAFNATKTLSGRDLEDKEFTFQVLDSNKTVITTGTNDVNGKVTFEDAINYTVESLKAAVQNGAASVGTVDGKRTWTIPYTVSEVTDGLADKGITVVAGSFQVGVAVTDNGDGTLTSAVFYPDGADGLTFENAYGAQSSVKLNINGTKNYDKSDLPNAPEIAGKFTFTLEAKDGGPLPQKDGVEVATATNDAAGNINFGQIEYTMENVFGNTDGVQTDGDGNRYKIFTYTVTESESEPGGVPGVSIDKTTKTFTVTITDNGDGSLSYKTDGDFNFAFTNTYEVKPNKSSVTDQITITKELDGREMAAGEFNFELVEMVDGVETVVAKGANAADGMVTFEAIEYTTPGEHDYLVREVTGDKGGVTYDTKTYSIHTSVTDNGNGTLSVKHELEDVQEALFTNTYEADPATVNLGAAKLLNNAKPGDARFTFQVLDKDGNVVAEAQNNEEGTIQFPELSFDTAGEYEYTIVEADDGQEGVTYDGSEHKIKITVTDNKEGSLVADIEGMDELILFSNTYTEPEDPSEPGGGKPDGSEPPALPDTSDTFGPLVIGLGALAVIACAGLVIGAVKMRRKPGALRSK